MKKHLSTRLIVMGFTIVILSVVGFYLWEKSKPTETIPFESFNKEDRQLDSLINYDFSKAKIYIRDLHDNALNKKDSTAIIHSYYYKMAISLKNNNFDSVPYFYKQIFEYTKGNDSNYFLAKANRLSGIHHMYISDYPKSLELLLKAEAYFKKNKDEYNLASTYNNLGALYSSVGEINKALEFYNKAKQNYIIVNDTLGNLMVTVNESLIDIQRGETKIASENLFKALRSYKQLNDSTNIAKILFVLSHIELKDENINKALEYLNQASDLAKINNDSILQSISLTNYGTIYEYQGNYDKAIDYYRKGISLSSNKSINLERLRKLSGLLKMKGEYKEAYEVLNHYYHLKDSINGGFAKQQFKNLEWNSVVNQLQNDHNLENKKQNRIKAIYSIGFVCILIISIITWLLYRNNKKNLYISRLENIRLEENVESKMQLQKLMEQQHEVELKAKNEFYELQERLREIENKSHEFENKSQKEIQVLQEKQHELEMESKNRELTTINLQLVSKSKLLNHIEQLIQKIPDKKGLIFKEIRDSIKESRNHNKDWEQFQNLFQKIHPNFFINLQKNYPDLTKTEIRICAYIKINMDNGSIAHLLNVSHQSLITNRYKIRKKINLNNRADDLDDFIRSIN